MNTVRTVLVTDHPFTPGFGRGCDECEQGLDAHHEVMVVPPFQLGYAPPMSEWPVETRPPVSVRACRCTSDPNALVLHRHWEARCRVCGDRVYSTWRICMTYANNHGGRHLGVK